MSVKRWMDKRYAQGREDARLGKRRDPGYFGEANQTYQRWAYDAGYAVGQREFDEMRRRLTAVPPSPRGPDPGIPENASSMRVAGWPRFRLWGRHK
jgi:hypothetical protein